MLPLKNRSWILKKRLSLTCNVPPSNVTGTEDNITLVDSSKLVYKISQSRIVPLAYFITASLGGSLFLDRTQFHAIDIILASVSFVVALFFLVWFLFYKQKVVIFDRARAMVSIPGPFWYKNVEVPFKDVVAIIRRETHYYAHLNVLNLYRPDGFKADVGINTQDLDTLQNDWAFYVWYMDKSRPLPPAPVFDAYRDSSNVSHASGKTS